MGRRNVDATLAQNLASAESHNARAHVICDFIEHYGDSRYDSNVTQKEHALQTAALALSDKANSSLVIAALLHDIGHMLLSEHAATPSFLKKDLRHQNVVCRVLRPYLSKSITGPIALHVEAKRYLCGSDPSYYSKLSDNTKLSLALQGGPMTATQLRSFEVRAFWRESLRLRRWDDAAKVSKKPTPSLPFFLPTLELALMQGAEES